MRTRSLVGAAVAGTAVVAFLRRRRVARAERVDLYFADGSMTSLGLGAPQADTILAAARDGLAAARG
jgi:hypothetical protein